MSVARYTSTVVTKLKGNIHILRMPSLSPSMTMGSITNFYKKEPGDFIPSYNLFADVEVQSLLKTELDRNIRLELELQDDLYLVKIFQEINRPVSVGTPIAIFCDEQEDVMVVDGLKLENSEFKMQGKNLMHVVWQAYVKSKSDSIHCGH